MVDCFSAFMKNKNPRFIYTMYYTIVLVIAVILLIVGLVLVGVLLTQQGRNAPFPDYQSVCPDFWVVDGSMCLPPISGVNTPSPDKFAGVSPSIQHTGVTVNGNKVLSLDSSPVGWSGLCAKTSWSRTNGIFWDGVANTNQCS